MKWLQKWFGSASGGRQDDEGGTSRGGRGSLTHMQKLLVAAGIGGVLLIMGSFFNVRSQIIPPPPQDPAPETRAAATTQVSQEQDMAAYEKAYEDELNRALQDVIGLEDVTVIVNLDTSEEVVYARNTRQQTQTTTEKDKEGGVREIEQQTEDSQLVLQRQNSDERPIPIKKIKPKVRGVLVVARGVENVQVKAWVIEAVERTLDVPPHRIAVLPKK